MNIQQAIELGKTQLEERRRREYDERMRAAEELGRQYDARWLELRGWLAKTLAPDDPELGKELANQATVDSYGIPAEKNVYQTAEILGIYIDLYNSPENGWEFKNNNREVYIIPLGYDAISRREFFHLSDLLIALARAAELVQKDKSE